MESGLFFIIVGCLALIALLFFIRPQEKEVVEEPPEITQATSPKFYQEDANIYARYLMTDTELDYFYFIESILPSGYRIFPQVSFNAFLHSDDISVRNQFNRKCCDFLLVRGDMLEPIIVIEVDDPKSHNHKRARENDAKRDAIVAEAGYKTLRIYNDLGMEKVKNIILNAIKESPL